ncbi:LPS O-antigen subunit length determinant protein (WzzB/FepE family) [Erwinia sp. TECH1]
MTHPDVAENELDIRGLCCALWRGKRWIIGSALLFALLAWLCSLLITPKWSTTAVTDRPTVNMLGNYYSQQLFLNNLDSRSSSTPIVAPAIADEAYQEFVMQLASYDTRREFWLQSDYYKQRQSGQARDDAALLDELIANIQYQPGDAAKSLNDSVKLIAETAPAANTLLRQYVAFGRPARRAAS